MATLKLDFYDDFIIFLNIDFKDKKVLNFMVTISYCSL